MTEPPFAGTEEEHLTGALDRQRTTFRWKADGLDAAGLSTRVGASQLTLGGLLKHLALVEDHYFCHVLDAGPYHERWEGDPFVLTEQDTPAALYALWDRTVARSRERLAAALADGGLSRPISVTAPDGTPASLRRMVCDLIEEYARHTGHADLLREAVDGRVGEDPPPGWQPGLPSDG
jgi:hypothetical protein